MGISRDVPQFVGGFVGTFQTSSTWSIAATGSTSHIVNNATTYYSPVIDRTELGALFQTVDVGLWLHSTFGSTMTGNSTPLGSLSLDVWLQHGASSSGGDAANLTEPTTYAAKVFFTCVDTTDMNKASTWLLSNQTSTQALNPGVGVTNTYDLNGAYRYLRAAFSVTRAVTTTCTDKVDGSWVTQAFVFRDGDAFPVKDLKYFSTSTTTST